MPARSDEDNLEAKLDLLIGLLRLAYRDPLEQRRTEILSDPASKAILQLTTRGWVDAGELKSVVAKRAKVSKPTVERRIGELVGDGALLRTGAGAHVSYRSSGLIDP